MYQELLQGTDALLVTHPTNIRYLTGFAGVTQLEREAYVLVTLRKSFLFTHSLHSEQAKKLARQSKSIRQPLNKFPLQCIEISREEPLSQQLKLLFNRHFPGRNLKSIKLGFEETNLTVAENEKLRNELPGIELVPTKEKVEKLRQIKQPDEIGYIKKAAKLTDECFNHIINQLKADVTEAEVAWEIETFFHKSGAGSAFPPIVAFGKNSSQPHYSPGSDLEYPAGMLLTGNDLVLLDFGARVNGYCADMTRVVFVGKPTQDQLQVYDAVLQSQQAAIEYLKNAATSTFARGPLAQGVVAGQISGSAADRIAREIIEQAGYPPYPHSLGHSVGLDIHEGPRLSIKKDETLNPGMIVTIEPAVYIEGKFGIRIEDLVLLKEEGFEILSKSPKKLTTL